ncbi:MAG: phosphatidylserine decarboxylase [Phycisphaerae bacterium]|nr:phosphatidylserine decarboxylase [Phycisphaerae bacterium]
MRIPLTKYGWPQVVVFPVIVLAVMIVFALAWSAWGGLPLWAILLAEALLASVLIWVLAFFRDPYRNPPSDKNLLLAPADGRITDIEIVEEGNFIGQKAMRIGIFLSIFSTHINRAPCNVKVEKITYRKGTYKNAASPRSGRVNESNNLDLVMTDGAHQRLIVRQISGAIARRIVCEVREGQVLTGGEKFGMIKFGSRTELYVPVRENAKCLVRIGDKVKAGLTPLVRYDLCPD